ncbi:MAG: hypothetical protein KIIPBIDF_01219 [Candidatus Methanoperedenaceae archaeon GB50]|nr:MAG: hypothetical protein KIIPBIDF_01219 [Candidatus Methanoperedenaceae archaeon GB50]
MGKPIWLNSQVSTAEYIGCRGERGEVKHLSTPRKESKNDSLSSGERKGNSPNQVGVKACGRCLSGVVGPLLGEAANSPGSYKSAL